LNEFEGVRLRSARLPSTKSAGASRPEVATNLSNIARLYDYMPNLKRRCRFTRALTIREEKLGHEHLDHHHAANLGAFTNLSVSAQKLAEFERAFSVREKVLGPDILTRGPQRDRGVGAALGRPSAWCKCACARSPSPLRSDLYSVAGTAVRSTHRTRRQARSRDFLWQAGGEYHTGHARSYCQPRPQYTQRIPAR
jgi:hypothetical protein